MRYRRSSENPASQFFIAFVMFLFLVAFPVLVLGLLWSTS